MYQVIVPEFASLLATLQVAVGGVFTIQVNAITQQSFFVLLLHAQVSFELLQTQCLSVFTITIETIKTFTFHLTSEDIENGNASFTLPPSVSVMDVCSVTGVIFGGNDVGNSTTADIQFPSGKKTVY